MISKPCLLQWPVRRFLDYSALVLSGLLLLWPAIWNRFPLLYWDSALYITDWLNAEPRLDRSIYYSFFLKIFKYLPFGPYLCVVVQAYFTVVLLYWLSRKLVNRRLAPLTSLAAAMAIALTPTSFHIVTLMPDVALIWVAIAMTLLAIEETIQGQLAAASILAMSISWHNSFIIVFLISTSVLLFVLLINSKNNWIVGKILLVLAVFVADVVFVVFNNYLVGLQSIDTPATFFIAGRLNQTSALYESFRELSTEQNELNPRPKYAVWADKVQALGRTPEQLLWREDSPLNQTYPRWNSDPNEYYLARDFLSPVVAHGLKNYAWDFYRSGKHNVTSMMVGEYLLAGFVHHGYETGVWRALERNWPEALQTYKKSRQALGDLPRDSFSWAASSWRNTIKLGSFTAILACIVIPLAMIVSLNSTNEIQRCLVAVLLLLATIPSNLLVSGFLAGLPTRYIERAIGLCPMAIVLVVFSVWAVFWRTGVHRSSNK